MVLKKIDITQHETLPAGCKFVNLDEKPLAVHKVTAELTGENFIENLEQVNRQRVSAQPEPLAQPIVMAED